MMDAVSNDVSPALDDKLIPITVDVPVTVDIPIINCHTQVDKQTVQFARFMWETMLSLANHPERLALTAHCMGPSAQARVEAWAHPRARAIIVPDKKGELHGSHGHAACVMSAIKKMGNGELHIIADSDTVVVAKGWDDFIRKRMIDDRIGIIGGTYEELGGFSSGANKVQTYKNIPTITWSSWQPMHDWSNIDVMPNKAHQVAITTPLLSQIYNLPQGYSVFGEAAWQLPQYLHNHSLTYDGWKQRKPTKDAIVLKGLSDYHEEFHVEDNIPFVVHHRGSMRHVYRGDKVSRQFYAVVDSYIMNELTRETPRWTWTHTEKSQTLTPLIANKETSAEVFKHATNTIPPEHYVTRGTEWLKISYNGCVIRPRKSVKRGPEIGLPLTFERSKETGHIRCEGILEHCYPITVPATDVEPYLLTCRNATGAALLVGCINKGSPIAVPPNKTWWLLVDVDGVQRVE